MNPELCLKRPSLWEKIIRLVYPAKCMVCDTVLFEDESLLICEDCRKKLPRYAKGFHRISELPFVNGIIAPFHYAEGVTAAVHNMKFNYQPRITETMSYLVCEQFKYEECLPDFDMILPVPMHPRKKRQRGYNQSELVANGLSAFLKVPVRTDILRKIKYTKPQSKLKREERLHNMVNVFSLQKGREIAGKNVLLVDDVCTTGTTLNTCAKILCENGASFVFAAVIAIAEK